MKGRIQVRHVKWLRVAFAVTVVIIAHALHGGSAQAATIDLRPAASARIAAASDPASTSDVVLAGFTSQRLPAFFKISGDGRVLLAGGIAIRLRCTSGATVIVPDAFARIPITNGRLQTSYTPPTTIENGVTTTGTDTLKARLSPTRSELNGTWRLRVHVSADGGQNMRCDSGPVHFAVTR